MKGHTATPRDRWKGMHRATLPATSTAFMKLTHRPWQESRQRQPDTSGHYIRGHTMAKDGRNALPALGIPETSARHPAEVEAPPPRMISRKPRHLGRHQSHDTATNGSGRNGRHRNEGPHGHPSAGMEGNAPRTLPAFIGIPDTSTAFMKLTHPPRHGIR